MAANRTSWLAGPTLHQGWLGHHRLLGRPRRWWAELRPAALLLLPGPGDKSAAEPRPAGLDVGGGGGEAAVGEGVATAGVTGGGAADRGRLFVPLADMVAVGLAGGGGGGRRVDVKMQDDVVYRLFACWPPLGADPDGLVREGERNDEGSLLWFTALDGALADHRRVQVQLGEGTTTADGAEVAVLELGAS